MTKNSGAVLLVVVALGFFAYAVAAADRGPQTEAAPIWEAGRCYRVFPHNRDQFYLFRVVETATGGPWVRVESHPSPPSQPGARPPAPLWLNAQSLFAVQAWTCREP